MKTEINIIELLILLLGHWFADFVMQTDEQAKGKSTSWKFLLNHTVTYSCIMWLIFGALYITRECNGGTYIWYYPILFGVITLIIHTAQDYITSRINSRLYKAGKIHNFFISIGFDQWLHAVQLILTYVWLS